MSAEPSPDAPQLSWGAAWTIARRDLNARFKGLRLLLVCIFLGTAALAAIGTLTAAIEGELGSRGQVLLGGDLEVEVWQRDLRDEEKAALQEYGELSGGTRMQAMANTGAMAAPVGLKAVADNWPLYGEFTLKDGRNVGAPKAGEAWLQQGVIDRLGIAVGDSFKIGTSELKVAGIIDNEPDKLSEGFQLGSTIIVAQSLPAEAGLTAPGALYESKYRVRFDGSEEPSDIAEQLEEQFPEAGLDFRTRDRASPGADRFVGRMSEFLTLVGLAALVIAGIGIGGGVSSYLEARRTSIATLKVLGASSRDISRIYALQIGAAALVGAIAGLIVGVAVTPFLGMALQGLLPVEGGFVVDAGALLLAAGFGLLVALVFAVTPIIRARSYPAMALMRARAAPLSKDKAAWPWVGGGLLAIVALVLITSNNPLLAGGFLAGAAALLILLAALGKAITWASRKIASPSNPLIRNALANIHRPGSSTGALVTALGFGLSAFVLLAAIQSSINGNIESSVPREAPDYFVLDIPRDRLGEFETLVTETDPDAMIRAVPTLRGAILAYGEKDAMIRVSELEEIPDGAWPLRGERGLSYADDLPEGNALTDGEWWGADYSGEPLVSVDEEFAAAIDLEVGDYLTVGILGVERTARVASLRTLEWENMSFNFVLVFSPNALSDAPHNLTATIDLTEGTETGGLLQSMVREFPSSSAIEIGQVLEQAKVILGQVGLATFAAASVAVLAGLAVLLGAIAAARAARMYDTVVLRVLGASRRQILTMQLAEYGLLALVLAIVSLVIGTGLAWLVITQLFEFDWLPDWAAILAVLGLGLGLVMAFALGGSLPLLNAKPAQALREL
ncbi:MAG: FtsX-like permease family protein [Marinomonas sp.]